MPQSLPEAADLAALRGAVRPDADVRDLLRLVHAITVATEQAPDGAERLLCLVIDGLRHQEST